MVSGLSGTATVLPGLSSAMGMLCTVSEIGVQAINQHEFVFRDILESSYCWRPHRRAFWLSSESTSVSNSLMSSRIRPMWIRKMPAFLAVNVNRVTWGGYEIDQQHAAEQVATGHRECAASRADRMRSMLRGKPRSLGCFRSSPSVVFQMPVSTWASVPKKISTIDKASKTTVSRRDAKN